MFNRIINWVSGKVFNNFAGPIVRRIVAGAVAALTGVVAVDPEVLDRWAHDTTTILMVLSAFASSLVLSWLDKFKKD